MATTLTMSSTRAAAGEVVDRAWQGPGMIGPIGLRARQALHQLVADVARLQVGEDQDVGLARHGAAGSLELADASRPERRPPAARRPALRFGRQLLGHCGGFAAPWSTLSCLALPLVEKESMATRGVDAAQRACRYRRVAIAMAASCSAVGSMITAQSRKDHHAVVAIGLYRASP